MIETLLNKYGINQIGFYVEDLEAAAQEFSALFGAGPFLYMDPITLSSDGSAETVQYKGKEVTITKQMAYGQFKDVQIELIQVLSDGPDFYKDLGRYGLHHFAIWADDPEKAIQELSDAGYDVAIQFSSGAGMLVTFIDCVEKWGYYLEIYAPIKGFWDMIKQASIEWDGTNPYRKIGT